MPKTQLTHDGVLYYSLPAAARLLGTTTTKLKQILDPEGIEYRLLSASGPLWINARDFGEYMRRKGLP